MDALDEQHAPDEQSTEIFSAYECRSHAYGARHPGLIVEAASLSMVKVSSNGSVLSEIAQW